MNLEAQNLTPQQLQRTLGMPVGGPKCVPINLDFSVSTTYNLDMSNVQSRGFFDMVQTVWVDNSLSDVILTITVPNTQQTLKIPAGIQGYFSVLAPNPVRMQFDSTGGVVCQVTLLNFPFLQ